VSAEQLQLRELLQRLGDAEIRFVLVGGLAVNAWGYLRTTRDVDVVPDPSKENLEQLDRLLRDLNGKVEVGEQLLDANAISTFLRTGDRTLVATDLGHVDVLQGLPQVPPFSILAEAATEVDMDGLVVRVCSLEHLLAMKRASDRPRDRDDLEALEAAQGGSEMPPDPAA
jgi:predicted nucleotidyltransferase